MQGLIYKISNYEETSVDKHKNTDISKLYLFKPLPEHGIEVLQTEGM